MRVASPRRGYRESVTAAVAGARAGAQARTPRVTTSPIHRQVRGLAARTVTPSGYRFATAEHWRRTPRRTPPSRGRDHKAVLTCNTRCMWARTMPGRPDAALLVALLSCESVQHPSSQRGSWTNVSPSSGSGTSGCPWRWASRADSPARSGSTSTRAKVEELRRGSRPDRRGAGRRARRHDAFHVRPEPTSRDARSSSSRCRRRSTRQRPGPDARRQGIRDRRPRAQAGRRRRLRVDRVPGRHRGGLRPDPRARVGLKHGIDFNLGYSPERINPGDKEHTLEQIIEGRLGRGRGDARARRARVRLGRRPPASTARRRSRSPRPRRSSRTRSATSTSR